MFYCNSKNKIHYGISWLIDLAVIILSIFCFCCFSSAFSYCWCMFPILKTNIWHSFLTSCCLYQCILYSVSDLSEIFHLHEVLDYSSNFLRKPEKEVKNKHFSPIRSLTELWIQKKDVISYQFYSYRICLFQVLLILQPLDVISLFLLLKQQTVCINSSGQI